MKLKISKSENVIWSITKTNSSGTSFIEISRNRMSDMKESKNLTNNVRKTRSDRFV